MVAVAALIPAPPLLTREQVGTLASSVPVFDGGDPHIGLGVEFERDVQIAGTAVWDGNACETGGSPKTATEISGTITGIPYTVFQTAKCRMLNEWNTLGPRLSTLFEVGEWRTIEEAFATAMVNGDYGTVNSGPGPADASVRATFAAAEGYIRDLLAYGIIFTSPEVVTFAISRDLVVRDGDRLFTELGTPVIVLAGLDATALYVTGQVNIWRGQRSEPTPVMEVPYTNEFVVQTERVYTIAVEGEDSMEIVNWTVDLTVS